MRIILSLLFMTLMAAPLGAAEEKKSEQPPEKPAAAEEAPAEEASQEAPEPKPQLDPKEAAKVLSVNQVSEDMAEIWCQKLAECGAGSEMGPKECRKVLKKSFQQGFKNTAQGQKVEVTKGTLQQCNESIRADTCESLKAAQNLPGCEFINLLNRG